MPLPKTMMTKICGTILGYFVLQHFSFVKGIYPQTSNISWTLVGCSNYIFIIDSTPSSNGLGKDDCKTRWETLKFGDLMQLILEVWWYYFQWYGFVFYFFQESMKMMGLNNWLHWSAWFIKYFLFLFVSVALMTLFFCAPMTRHGSVIGYTSTSLLMFFLMVYAVATISFCFMLSTFFSKGKYMYKV